MSDNENHPDRSSRMIDRWRYFTGAIYSRVVTLPGLPSAVVLCVIGIYTSTTYRDVVDQVVPALAAGVVLATSLCRIELRLSELCMVNILTVSRISKNAIVEVQSQPRIALRTETSTYASSAFPASLYGRASNYAGWESAAGFIRAWKAENLEPPEGSRGRQVSQRARWELILYVLPFVVVNALIAAFAG